MRAEKVRWQTPRMRSRDSKLPRLIDRLSRLQAQIMIRKICSTQMPSEADSLITRHLEDHMRQSPTTQFNTMMPARSKRHRKDLREDGDSHWGISMSLIITMSSRSLRKSKTIKKSSRSQTSSFMSWLWWRRVASRLTLSRARAHPSFRSKVAELCHSLARHPMSHLIMLWARPT